MSSLHVKHLLIGGGLATSAAVTAIRKLDPRSEVLIIAAEKVRPYNRPPLSKDFLRRQTLKSELFTLPVNWFSDHRVQLRTGLRASHLDTNRRIVTLENGQEVSFDTMLIATGLSAAHLSIPGADFPNVHYVRTMDDVERLHNAIEKAKREGSKHPTGTGRGRVAVVGAGVLGVELAASLRQVGLAVDLFASKAHPWDKFAGEHTGGFVARYLESHGVTFHASSPPLRLEGDGRVQRVVVNNTTQVSCDFVVASVGAVFNRELLRNTPLTAEKAILVDDHCRTNVPGIYAAGDCAAVFDPLFGKHRVLDHWDNAQVTGTIAGTNMAGGEAKYDAVNLFFSDVFDLAMQTWGEARQVDRRLIRGNTSTDAPDFIEIGIAADGRIAQIIAMNHKGEDDLLRMLVGQRARVDGNEEFLKDPTYPLRTLLP
jgi:3-phenylpropionate/trans-cinnamate dioxygenase ferredoxin reductase subunit